MRSKIAAIAATVLLAGGALAATEASASAAPGHPEHAMTSASVASPAAEGTWPIDVPGCHVSEEVELQGSPKHDYMRWETTGNSIGCEVAIYRNSVGIENQEITTTGYHKSDWYYDGPGYSADVCVVASSGFANCGPSN